MGPLRSDSVIKLVSDLITESDQAVRAVHSCNSWLPVRIVPMLSCSELTRNTRPVLNSKISPIVLLSYAEMLRFLNIGQF